VLAVVLTALGIYAYLTHFRLGSITYFDFVYSTYYLLTLQFGLISPNIRALAIDVVFFAGGGAIIWLAFFAQFVLPVRTLKERQESIVRLVAMLGNDRGPAVFVNNGVVVDAPKTKKRRGPGVIVLDSASAAVLHNQSAFTRAVGPGLQFTKRGEQIAGALDLHTQIRQLGPLEEEDPFVEDGEGKEKGRRDRRLQTSGLTRDGVEVVPNIQTIFRIQSKPGEGGTEFGYNADAVWRTVAYEGVDPQTPSDAESRRVPWDWLPVHVAADLWREYLRKFTLNELFDFTSHPLSGEELEAPQRKTVLEIIIELINKRLKQPHFTVLDEVGRATGGKLSSREHRMIRERGLDIIAVRITNLRLENTIEEKFIDGWNATWLNRAKEEQRYIEQRGGIEKSKGQQTAIKEFAQTVSERLYWRIKPVNEQPIDPPNLSEALELLVRGTRDGIARDSSLHHQLVDEENSLIEVLEWLRKRSNGKSN
jgi:hypothetical protein